MHFQVNFVTDLSDLLNRFHSFHTVQLFMLRFNQETRKIGILIMWLSLRCFILMIRNCFFYLFEISYRFVIVYWCLLEIQLVSALFVSYRILWKLYSSSVSVLYCTVILISTNPTTRVSEIKTAVRIRLKIIFVLDKDMKNILPKFW